MQTQQTITRTVQILDILPDAAPHILTAEYLSRNGKPGRLFQQMLPVPDAELFARLVSQVRLGDTLTITVTTEWTDAAVRSYLSDFAFPVVTFDAERETLPA